MTPAQWQRARNLFEQAVDLPADEIQHWLAQRESDPAVVAEVRSLLEHHTAAGAFLDEAVAGRVSDLLAEDTVFEPGATLGDYVIQKELGRGGMGRVYLATDQHLGRSVALKVLAPRFVRDEAQRARLRQEARAAAALNHPGICTIYALEELDDHVAIAAEYIDGHPLREEISGAKRPSPRELVDAARELIAALAAAHARGITHRDLKPENVMRTRTGHLKILDFGLALMQPQEGSAAALRMTTPGTLVGTPSYMAPEQLSGGTVDVRTDLFALGVMLYEFATGLHPFAANSGIALAARILESHPRPIATLRGDLPRQLSFVIERCLQKKADDRFVSAGEVLLAIATDDLRPAGQGGVGWWRNHMGAMLGLYFAAAGAGWLVKEWSHGIADPMFVVIALAAVLGGVLRSHLLFTERAHDRGRVLGVLARGRMGLTLVDLAIGVALLFEGLWSTRARPLGGVLIAALGLWFAVARVWIEPGTTDAAFGADGASSTTNAR
jgi:tRNA A-37 threonylcarbamoyl transferase component Bud32